MFTCDRARRLQLPTLKMDIARDLAPIKQKRSERTSLAGYQLKVEWKEFRKKQTRLTSLILILPS